MTPLRVMLKSRHCSGCLRTVDLEPIDAGEASSFVCSRTYAVPRSVARDLAAFRALLRLARRAA